MILSDKTIKSLCQTKSPMIDPFIDHNVSHHANEMGYPQPVISYGLSSFGYDIRIADQFKIFTNVKNAVIDPLALSDDYYFDHTGDYCIIPPNSYILGHSVEYFKIPKDVMVLATGKSTLARLATSINITPIEPGFEGQIVIEVANNSPLPVKIYANMGISQLLFFKGDHSCEVSYADRKGKYQGQSGLTLARV